MNENFLVTLENLKNSCRKKALELIDESKSRKKGVLDLDYKKKILTRIKWCSSLSDEVDQFIDLIFHAQSKKEIIQSAPIIAGFWYGDEYDDVKGIDAIYRCIDSINNDTRFL